MLPAGTGHPYGGNYAFFAPPEPAEQVKGLPLFAWAAYAHGGASPSWLLPRRLEQVFLQSPG